MFIALSSLGVIRSLISITLKGIFPFQGGGWLRGSGSPADQQEVIALVDLPNAGLADVP